MKGYACQLLPGIQGLQADVAVWQRALDSSGLGTAGPRMLANPLLLLSPQIHPTDTTWNDKEPPQAKVRCIVRASPRGRAPAFLESSREGTQCVWNSPSFLMTRRGGRPAAPRQKPQCQTHLLMALFRWAPCLWERRLHSQWAVTSQALRLNTCGLLWWGCAPFLVGKVRI